MTKEQEEQQEGEEEEEEQAPAQEEEDGDKSNETRDPQKRIASLLGANARLSKKITQREATIRQLEKQLEEGGSADGEVTSLRIEAAFWRHVAAHPVSDAEAALDLLSARGFMDTIKVGDDGKVTGMGEAMAHLVKRYRWLGEDEDSQESEDDEEGDSVPRPRTRHPQQPKRTNEAASRRALEERFPALRGRRVMPR